jgi:putative component of toxin-antitoxin plasmid stabilization module
LGGSAGTVVLNISATDTANMSVGDGVYDLRITAGDGTISRILEGTFAVRGAVSR